MPTPWEDLLSRISTRRLAEVLQRLEAGALRPSSAPVEDGSAAYGRVNEQELRLVSRLTSLASLRQFGFREPSRRGLGWRATGEILAFLHEWDRDLMFEHAVSSVNGPPLERGEIVAAACIEEAIASCAFDGLEVSDGKELLRTGRRTADRAESAVRACHETLCGIFGGGMEPLFSEGVQRLNARLTGRESMTPVRDVALDDLCEFANGGDEREFVHPFVRAAATHVVVLREQPFAEANGRTARALFLQILLRNGYDSLATLSISQAVRTDPRGYPVAWITTGGDDLTPLLLEQAGIVRRAAELVRIESERKRSERERVGRMLAEPDALNPRQVALLAHAAKHPETVYTIEAHRHSHGIVYQTARTDLLDLADRGLLELSKRGKTFVFHRASPFASPRRLDEQPVPAESFTPPIPEDLGFPL